jgi:hypothetical protein
VVGKAIARLAFLTDLLGESRMQQYAAAIPDLAYKEGLFLRVRPGLVLTPPLSGQGVVAPLPLEPGQVQP